MTLLRYSPFIDSPLSVEIFSVIAYSLILLIVAFAFNFFYHPVQCIIFCLLAINFVMSQGYFLTRMAVFSLFLLVLAPSFDDKLFADSRVTFEPGVESLHSYSHSMCVIGNSTNQARLRDRNRDRS